MEFEQVIIKRRMTRDFDSDKQIPEKAITKLLSNTQRAPGARHTQVQEFVAIMDPTTREKLRQVEQTPTLIVVCSNTSRSDQRCFKIVIGIRSYNDVLNDFIQA
jgi:nitroreductase